jgi:SAM-dependent methyltransferase
VSQTLRPEEVSIYTRIAGDVYDLVYSDKDYAGETAKVVDIIDRHCESGGKRLLDVACGTGAHMALYGKKYSVDGFDLSAEQVTAARLKLPKAHIIQADMLDFDIGQQYDAILSLFSSIGYLKTKGNLDRAIANMSRHTKPGGLVIIEPWLKAERLVKDRMSFVAVHSKDSLSVACMGRLETEGNMSTQNMHYMVGTLQRVDHLLERHRLAMYTDEEFTDAFSKAGLEIEIDPIGITGRGLLVGKKPKIC